MKEMFYLTTHSTHFILRLYGIRRMVKEGWKKCYLTMHSTHFSLRLYGVGHMVNEGSRTYGKGRKEMFYLTMHSTHFFIYSYMVSDIW